MQNYSNKVKDHYHHPRNFGSLQHATHIHEELNAACGDETKIYLKIAKLKIENFKHETRGCVICVASASAVSAYLIGKNLSEIKKLNLSAIEKLLDVKISPARASCATLVITALNKAARQASSSRG